MTSRRRRLRAAQIVAAATGLALLAGIYWSSLFAPFVMEDIQWLIGAQGTSLWSARGLTALTWVWTPTPQLAHGVNIALHGITVLLVWLLARGCGATRVVATAAAGAMLAHPLAVQGVAYATGRGELLGVVFVLLGCIVATNTSDRGWRVVIERWPIQLMVQSAGGRGFEIRARVVVMLVAFALVGVGIWCKESAVAGLVLVLLVRYAVGRPPGWPYLAGACYAVGMLTWAYGGVWLAFNADIYATEVVAVDWLLVQVTATMRLIGVFVTGVGMTPDYDYDLVPFSWRVLSLAGVAGIAGLAYRCWTRQEFRMVGFGLAFALIAVAPRWVVQTPRSYLAEHQFRLALVGLAVAGAGLLQIRQEDPDDALA